MSTTSINFFNTIPTFEEVQVKLTAVQTVGNKHNDDCLYKTEKTKELLDLSQAATGYFVDNVMVLGGHYQYYCNTLNSEVTEKIAEFFTVSTVFVDDKEEAFLELSNDILESLAASFSDKKSTGGKVIVTWVKDIELHGELVEGVGVYFFSEKNTASTISILENEAEFIKGLNFGKQADKSVLVLNKKYKHELYENNLITIVYGVNGIKTTRTNGYFTGSFLSVTPVFSDAYCTKLFAQLVVDTARSLFEKEGTPTEKISVILFINDCYNYLVSIKDNEEDSIVKEFDLESFIDGFLATEGKITVFNGLFKKSALKDAMSVRVFSLDWGVLTRALGSNKRIKITTSTGHDVRISLTSDVTGKDLSIDASGRLVLMI